jgi:hypothetical protein
MTISEMVISEMARRCQVSVSSNLSDLANEGALCALRVRVERAARDGICREVRELSHGRPLPMT